METLLGTNDTLTDDARLRAPTSPLFSDSDSDSDATLEQTHGNDNDDNNNDVTMM